MTNLICLGEIFNLEKEFIQFTIMITLLGFLFYFLATSTGCGSEVYYSHSFWHDEVVINNIHCQTMCNVSGGMHLTYNYATNYCFCKKTDNITWKVYHVYDEDGVYIEVNDMGQIELY